MGVSLVKGGNVSLAKADPSLKKLLIGLGWAPRKTDGQKFDLDASVFMLGANGLLAKQTDLIFYNTPKSSCGSVTHMGDNQTGEGEGDDEKILVLLDQVPASIEKLVVTVSIDRFDERKQTFGMVDDSYIRLVNEDTGAEIARYDLGEDASTETAMVFGEVYRHDGGWKFKAVGQGYAAGINSLADLYGFANAG